MIFNVSNSQLNNDHWWTIVYETISLAARVKSNRRKYLSIWIMITAKEKTAAGEWELSDLFVSNKTIDAKAPWCVKLCAYCSSSRSAWQHFRWWLCLLAITCRLHTYVHIQENQLFHCSLSVADYIRTSIVVSLVVEWMKNVKKKQIRSIVKFKTKRRDIKRCALDARFLVLFKQPTNWRLAENTSR